MEASVLQHCPLPVKTGSHSDDRGAGRYSKGGGVGNGPSLQQSKAVISAGGKNFPGMNWQKYREVISISKLADLNIAF